MNENGSAQRQGALHAKTWFARMRPYSMDARSDLLGTYAAVLFVGILAGVVCFLIWGKAADAEAFWRLWVRTRSFSGYESGAAFFRFFCSWFFRYEFWMLLLLLFSATLFSPVLCGGVVLWRGFCTGFCCAMLAGKRFSLLFVGFTAFSVAISLLYVMAACKSVGFFRNLVSQLRRPAPRFVQEHVCVLGISFVLHSAAIAVGLLLCAVTAQLIAA